MERKNITIFTDGSTLKNGRNGAISGIGVYFQNDFKNPLSLNLYEAKKLANFDPQLKSTNNTSELLSILVALTSIDNKDNTVIVYTDSMYSINCICTWTKKWISNGWKTADDKNVKNKELIQRILLEKDKFKSIVFLYVKAHTIEPSKDDKNYDTWYGNDRADKLATDASKKVASRKLIITS